MMNFGIISTILLLASFFCMQVENGFVWVCFFGPEGGSFS